MTIKIEDLDKIDFSDVSDGQIMPGVTVGEMLTEEFMVPLGWSKYKLAKELGVDQTRVGEIIAGKRAVTVDTDLRLCKLFGLSDGWWLRLQVGLDVALAKAKMKKVLAGIQPVV
ncbi:MAG: HigA family addiction module antitoxin [Pseudomonadota bacterium]|nr:HigA family addiction module antitoxin [Pseudomonadota bacterium]